MADSTLVEVLVDLHLARARAQIYEDVPPSLRDSILARRGINARAYEEAMDYYTRHPEAYARLYTTVLEHLDAERSAALDSTGRAPSQ